VHVAAFCLFCIFTNLFLRRYVWETQGGSVRQTDRHTDGLLRLCISVPVRGDLGPKLKLTSQSAALLEKPPVVQLLKEPEGSEPSPGPYPEPDQSGPTTPSYLWSISILSIHLRFDLPSGLFLLGFSPISYIHYSSPPFVLHALSISSSLIIAFWWRTGLENCWTVSWEKRSKFQEVPNRPFDQVYRKHWQLQEHTALVGYTEVDMN
jgi:hypothetical protein